MFYAGEQGGDALVSVLSGDVSPSGKMPVSVPRSTGHIPCYYNYKPSARGFYKNPGNKFALGRDYVTDTPEALFEFGYGLSYTTFKYSDLLGKVEKDGTVRICVKVRNIGSVKAKETVLLFLKAEFCEVTQPVKRLCSFKKVEINPNDFVEVEFKLTKEELNYVGIGMKRKPLHGKQTFQVSSLFVEVEL